MIGNQLRDTSSWFLFFMFAHSSVREESGSTVPLNQGLIQYGIAEKGYNGWLKQGGIWYDLDSNGAMG